MTISDLYHKRMKRERGEYPEIYQYESLPTPLKVQIVHIWNDTIGKNAQHRYRSDIITKLMKYYEAVFNLLCKEMGVFELTNNKCEYHRFEGYYLEKVIYFFLNQDDVEIALSVIELMTRLIQVYFDDVKREAGYKPKEVIEELNYRFKEHGVGYQFENGQIIRIDSQYVHSEVVKPVLSLLSDPVYAGAQQEFLMAHEHYRHQRYQPAMVECLKAYESTIKIIMTKRGWQYSPDDTANALTGKIMQQGLIPDYLLQYFKSLKNTLVSSLASVRNNEAGHGQGVDLKNVPEYLVSYMLHMTASAILFLIQAEKALP